MEPIKKLKFLLIAQPFRLELAPLVFGFLGRCAAVDSTALRWVELQLGMYGKRLRIGDADDRDV